MLNRRSMIIASLSVVPAAACAQSNTGTGTAITVYKSPSGGCCAAWVDHLRGSGFKVAVRDMDDVGIVARKAGVPENARSCHTGLAGGYFIEGHVPAADIRRLLRERPRARGLSVPGMPMGSPGMEQGNRKQPYNTLIIDRGGTARVFARHNQA